MRGFTVVLYVAVLLSLLSVAFAANCGANGDVSPLADICICKSGYSGASCAGLTSSCDASEAAIQPAEEVADNFPKLNATDGATRFEQNTLKAEIVGDHVANRTYKELTFNGTNGDGGKCSFGSASSYWTMDFKCKDRFTLALPWISHKTCGFHVDAAATNNEFLVITNTLHLKYEDWVYIDMGVNEATNETEIYKLERLVSIPYRMSVKFQKYINVTLLALNITSDVNFGAALTLDEYNPESRLLTLEITTVINYPNSFSTRPVDIIFVAPEQVHNVVYAEKDNALVWFKNVDTIGVDCDPRADVTCTQKWEVRLQSDNCTFDGAYRMTLRLYTCRSINNFADMACTNTIAHVNFTLETSDICGSIEVEPEVKGELVPYKHGISIAADEGPAVAKKEFKLGEYGNFWAKINSAGNDIKINFTDVRFTDKKGNVTEADWVYLYKNKAHISGTELVQLELHHSQKYFQLYFHSSVFRVPPREHIVYTFSAWVDILFLGNEGEQKKRSVEYTFEAESMDTQARIGLVAPSASVKPQTPAQVITEKEGVKQTTFVASVVGAIAGTMLIVFVVVGVALRTRNQSAKRDAAASAAVVAANAAAQSIEVVSRV